MSIDHAVLERTSAASGDKITQMLVNGILNQDHGMVAMAQGVIKARGEMSQRPEFQAEVTRIASGLGDKGVQQRGTGSDIAVS